MKGNYQEAEQLMKFTPDASGMADVYQIQQYIRPSSDVNSPDSESDYMSFSVVANKVTDYNALP